MLHLDHGLTEERVKEAIKLGFTSVMYDCSSKPYEENKKCLDTLNQAYITAIDNVNAELKVNFGYWAGYKVNRAGRSVKTEEIE